MPSNISNELVSLYQALCDHWSRAYFIPYWVLDDTNEASFDDRIANKRYRGFWIHLLHLMHSAFSSPKCMQLTEFTVELSKTLSLDGISSVGYDENMKLMLNSCRNRFDMGNTSCIIDTSLYLFSPFQTRIYQPATRRSERVCRLSYTDIVTTSLPAGPSFG